MVQTFRRRVAFLTVLRHRDFRRFYIGLLASVSASQAMIAVQGWLVYDLTGLPAALGFTAAAEAVPSIALNFIAGALADRIDPRRMIVWGEGCAAALMVVQGLLVITGTVQVWHVVVIAFLVGIAVNYDQPARRTIWPVLVPRGEMLYAASINQTVWNGTRVIAPPIGLGIVAIGQHLGNAHAGAAFAFWVIGAGYLAMAVTMLVVRLPALERARGATVFHDMVDGVRFAYRNRIFFVLLLMSFVIGYFGLSYTYLLPAFAHDVSAGGAGVLATLLAANGAGGVAGVLGTASFGGYQNRTWLLIGGAVSFGVAVIFLALTGPLTLLWLAIVFAGLSGTLYSLFQVAANTMLNLLVPNEYRGRILGLRGVMWGLAPLGALQASLIATWVNTPFAIGLGGAVVIVFALAVLALSSEVRDLRRLVENPDSVPWARSERKQDEAATA